ncbi:GNAT family N-acetyltransferase [Falsibacillus pallidus]|uniref:Ribosomal-protein-alanine N-acetyltransferase n=1 Tax=Falsibacillus pallidus TaxID=493781 RepID=A0A370GP21_9BACI|nr:GNAT family protein [Falsibacillus pallidus]RDI45417.1 ribosomal-protein-alanine N-acetyltransferase [Falsibacillus pallidus]
MIFPTLETERLKLVEITMDYLEDYFSIMSYDEVTKYYGMNSLTDKEDAERIISSFGVNFQDKRGIRWGIVLKENNRFIGTVGLNALQIHNKRCEVGYEIHPDTWKKGYTSEAVKKVLEYCFEDLMLYRVGAVTFMENEPSFKLLLKLGFQKEGVLRGYLYQNEISHDAFIFSMTNPDWNKMKI